MELKHQLIRNLCAPVKPADKEYQDLIKLVKDHYSPRIVQRFKFNMRSRQSHETIATFVAELGKFSEFCNYGDMLEDMLWDRIVCGINNPAR